jgi:monovalent cation/hydrogen antiporter
LDGESLVNDATSFTAYRFAVLAVTTGAFSLAGASAQFVAVVIGGIIVGLAVGWVVTSVQRLLDDPPVQTTLSLLTPYVTYLTADALQVSGVLAVVVAGLYVGWRAPEVLTARMRLVALSVWDMVVFILNGFIFILIGLQLPEVVHNFHGHSLEQAIWLSALVVALIIVVRILWFFSSTFIARLMKHDSRCRVPRPNWRHLVLLSWAGMRGVDSLAAALALPFVTQSGDPFPDRELIVFITFSVILGTLVLQGLSLSPIIRWLKIVDDHSLEEEERLARLKANQAALAKITEIAKARTEDGGMLGRLRDEYEERIQQLTTEEDETDHKKLSLYSAEYEELSRKILGEERKTILHLRNERVINDHVLRRIQRDLDLAEARLEHGGE